MNLSTSNYYARAPLPFTGQKWKFSKKVSDLALKTFKNCNIFVDVFGGSGLLSNNIKYSRNDAQVFYNDYDNYCERVKHIEEVNALLKKLREFIEPYKRHSSMSLSNEDKEKALKIISEQKYVDYLTISSWFFVPPKVVFNLKELLSGKINGCKEKMYNRVPKTPYKSDGYLSGVQILHNDYHKTFECFKNNDEVCFIVDPPYLGTDCSTYKKDATLYNNYLDVFDYIKDSNFIYFCSSKHNFFNEIKKVSPNFFDITESLSVSDMINSTSKVVDYLFYRKLS